MWIIFFKRYDFWWCCGHHNDDPTATTRIINTKTFVPNTSPHQKGRSDERNATFIYMLELANTKLPFPYIISAYMRIYKRILFIFMEMSSEHIKKMSGRRRQLKGFCHTHSTANIFLCTRKYYTLNTHTHTVNGTPHSFREKYSSHADSIQLHMYKLPLSLIFVKKKRTIYMNNPNPALRWWCILRYGLSLV